MSITDLIYLANYDFNYGYQTPTTSIFTGALLVPMIIGIISIIAVWKLFAKAGRPGWYAIIPIYNFYVLIDIAELPIKYFVFLFIPFLNIYSIFKTYIELAHKFGKSTAYGIGMIFFSYIFIPLLAFGNSTYEQRVTPTFRSQNQSPVYNRDNTVTRPTNEPRPFNNMNNNMNSMNNMSTINNNVNNYNNDYVQQLQNNVIHNEPIIENTGKFISSEEQNEIKKYMAPVNKPVEPTNNMNETSVNNSIDNIDRPNAMPVSDTDGINNPR